MIHSPFRFHILTLAALSLSGMLSVGNVASACTLSNWDTQAGGITDVANAGLPRFQGECGFQATAAGQYVADNTTADNVTQYVAAFYVKTGATDNVKVFAGFAGAAEQFSLTINAGTAQLALVGGGTASAAIDAGLWNHIKIVWDPVTPIARLVVNGGAVNNTTSTPAAATLTAARLGWISGTAPSGRVSSDSFKSFRNDSTSAAETVPACPGDATSDNLRTVQDALQIFNDGTVNIVGYPDFNRDGLITVQDALGTFNAGACP